MSMFENMMSFGQQLSGNDQIDSQTGRVSQGQDQIMDALLMDNLQGYKGGHMQGPQMGMPGKVGGPTVDQMMPQAQAAMPDFKAPDTNIMANIMKMFAGGM